MSWSVGTVYSRPWFWKKGNRVSTVSDVLTIKIGGDPTDKKAKKKSNNRIKSTKYTLITFLPQNLLEQFRRIANFYFLIMVIISIVIVSPVSPLTSLIPLVFVISVTAAKQGYEDFLRHRADNMVNLSFVTVVRNGIEVDIKCEDIIQGDLVKAVRDCDVPCDIVLLKTSDPHGKCFITTANLDGETNLKTLTVPRGLPNATLDKLHTLGVIECETPRTDLYTFNGRIELGPIYRKERLSTLSEITPENSHTIPLTADNLLLRGSRVKNTEWTIGCAVYTGQNTKLSLNSRLTRSKMSSSEKFVNKFLVFFLLLLIAVITVSYFLKRYYDMYDTGANQYLGEIVATFAITQFLQDYFSFLILFNYLIPISLYVTIEMHKFIGSFFMEWDPDLFDSDTNQPFIVNTSDLNEELGQVEILFSDKTGTLTKNEMILQQCSINGRIFALSGTGIKEHGRINVVKIHEFKEDVFDFFKTLAICHTVQVAGSETGNAVSEEIIQPAEATTAVENHASSNGNNGNIIPNDRPIIRRSKTNEITAQENDSQESVQKVIDFNNITEENTPESDLDETDFISKLERLIPATNGKAVTDDLLVLDILKPRVSNGSTAATSSMISFAIDGQNNINNNNNNNVNNNHHINRHHSHHLANNNNYNINLNNNTNSLTRNNKIHPKQPLPLNEFSFSTPPSPINMTRTKLQRPLSTDFKRTISAVDEERLSHMTHRRTQSYAATTSFNRQQDTVTIRPKPKNVNIFGNTGSVTNMREYYAAPSYIGSSLLERKESMRRKKEILTVVENLDYQASSPDEKALVEGCAKVGFLYTGEVDDTMTVKLQPFKGAYARKMVVDTDMRFERLATLEFSSDRKRMSTIVRDHNNNIWLLTKGAESYVLPLCQSTPRDLIEKTLTHVNEFAKVGLRTLAVARKRLTEEEYVTYTSDLISATNSLTDRKELIEAVQSKLENNLELLGATAVEDALQDNVRDTLESLRFAGIKVWVLTGDKVETALNIALSCGHIPENAQKYFITECTEVEQLQNHFDTLEREMEHNPNGLFSLLIDGSSLAIALKQCDKRFRDLSIKCRAVLCCRLSPLQKCEVVHLMKTAKGKPITASIGDGANDVSMIQEAHVGLGIVGKEGRQAARCADYAFANFAMLKKVLLVHGYYYTHRLGLLVLYFFYKNLVFMAIQLFFQVNSMFSTQTVYDSVFLTLYNVVYTSLPVLFISLTEKMYPEEKLLSKPELYIENIKNEGLTWKYFCGWMLLACYHSGIIYAAGYIMWINNNAILPEALTVDFYCYGTFMIHNVVVLVNLKLWLASKYQSFWFIATVLGSIAVFMLTTLIYNFFDLSPLRTMFRNFDGNMLWVYNTLLAAPTFWLLFVWVIIAGLLPDYTIKVFKDFGFSLSSLNPANGNCRPKRLFDNHRRAETTYL